MNINNKKKKICIITPSYISYTPRVVKEADALVDAGYEVRVVFAQGNKIFAREYDRNLLINKKWKYSIFKWSKSNISELINYYRTGIRYKFLNLLPTTINNISGIVENTEGRVYSELASIATSEKADLYIGHYPAGLAAAAYAARKWKTKYAFDSEDLHSEEQDDTIEGMNKTNRIKILENKYLNNCEYISTVSELVSERISQIYKVKKPLVIRNVFQLLERCNFDNEVLDRKGNAISLYWYSQVIGEGRGLEDLINAVGLINENIQIHLRGNIDQNYKKSLEKLADSNNISNILYFHPQVSSTDLYSRCYEHDIGLALEQNVSNNKMLTISNKLFFYMLAGLAVLSSNTPGQITINDEYPKSGLTFEVGNIDDLSKKIKFLIRNPSKLKEFKRNSYEYATIDLNWEKESTKLIEKINSIF